MRVLIVAKTRMGKGACIGGITETGKSVRLVPLNADPHDGANREYEVGDIWEIAGEPVAETSLIPPHVEDIIVRKKHRLYTTMDTGQLVGAIELLMPPKIGDPRVLYEGLLQTTRSGSLYVAAQDDIPSYSTAFWRPDRQLIRDTEDKRIRYRYPTENGGCSLTFVGFDEPLEIIPAGMLIRVSLAHRWRPEDNSEIEERCYAQISGWFFEKIEQEETERSREDDLTSKPIPTQTPLEILTNVFEHEQFRPFQEEIIEHILSRQDALIVLPTGGGKSLCYQLPALIFQGLTVVVSPLISLMEDQVMKLQDRGIPTAFLNSTLNYSEYVATMQAVRQGETKLLYVAPESLVKPEILVMLDEANVACFAIDEAHCISQWGHDFRPDYRELVSIRQRFPNAVCMALTATATPRVQTDIKQLLEISDKNKFIASFDRPNLYISVEPKVDLFEQTLIFLNTHCGESGIIYCQTIRQVKSLCNKLTARRISVLPYHAELDDETRKQNQEEFINGNVRVMVATIAFGMGIDKPDVRFVLHAGLPKEPESYYQEIGRSGRDGLRANCLLLFSYGDLDTNNYFIEQGARSESQERQKRLQSLVSWVTSIDCRRRLLLNYFGEQYELENCGMCDNCRRCQEERVDLTIPAQKYLSCVYRTGQLFGEDYIIDVLRGSERSKIIKNRHNELPTHGTGIDYSKGQWRFFSYQFIQYGLISREARHGSIHLTQKGRDVLYGIEQFWGSPINSTDNVNVETNNRVPTSDDANSYDPALYEKLREKRRSVADRERISAYVVLHDRTLQEMATYFPRTEDEFMQIHGVGQSKIDKYADDFLPIIQDYCKEHGIDSTATGTETLNTSEVTSERQSGCSQELFEQLQDKCKILEKAEQEGIFTNGTLREMATFFPRTREAFVQIRGVSLRKMEKYADDFLPIIRDYCKEHGID